MIKTIYQRRTELYRKWSDLKSCMADENLSFEKWMEIKEQEDDAYNRWYFYDNYIKATNKLKEVKQ